MLKTSMQGNGISGLPIQKTNSFKGFSRILIVFAITFVAVNLFCFNSAFANKRVTAVTYGSQTGTANGGTGTSVTYTITLSEAGALPPSADNILLTWTSGTPTGVTWNFTSGTEAVTSGNTTTPSFTPSGTNGATITFTVTTSASTPAGSYGFTIQITDNNVGGGPYPSSGLTLLVNAVSPTISYTGSPFTYYTGNTITSLTPTVTNSPTSYSISPALPAGLAFSTTTGVISGTPTATHVATTYTITATNASGSGNTTISITVLASTISYTGSPFTYTIYTAITPLTPTTTGGAPTGYSISPALPAGLSINAATGVISGTPTVLSAATSYTITATYASGPSTTANISITINKAVLTITANNQSMVYGSAVPSLTVTYSGFVNGDTQANLTTLPTVVTTGTSSSNVGTYPITASGAVAPAYYTVNYVAGTLTITPKTLTISGLTGNGKIYDRTTTATLSGTATLNGVVGADVVVLGGSPTAVFSGFNVGAGVSITVTGYSISGANAGNYTLSQPVGLTANITPKSITVTLAVASNKVYDGTTNASVLGATINGLILPDILSISTTGIFASPNVGNNIPVSLVMTGVSSGNYTLVQPGITANITAAPLTITATNVSKVYGNVLTSGPGSTAFTSSGLQNGETIGSVTMTYGTGGAIHDAVGSYAGHITPSAATGGTFTPSNYSITYVTGNITVTAAPLTITGLSVNSKVYDRTTTGTLSGTATLNGVVAGDVVTLGGAPTATFATANVGLGIVVTVSGYTISGAAAGNYTLTQPSGFTADITAKALTIASAAASNKVYDGTNTATITGTLTGVVAGDVVTLNLSGTFPDKNVGTGLAVTPTCTLSGANAGNYTLTQPVGLTANITAKTLTITGITAANKVYDGTTTGSLSGSGSLTGVIAGDVVTFGGAGTAVFASKNVGTGIAVTVSSYSISGTDAGNYTLTQPSGLTANITVASLTITATGPLKVTGFTSPVQTGATSNFIYYGTVAGETITSVTLTPSPTTSQTAGSAYTVTPSAAGGANGYLSTNYTITYVVYNGTVAGFSYVWTGNTNTTWSTNTNWSPNGTPGSTDNVSIPATANAPTVTSSTSVNTATFTGNNTITINSGINLTINNGFNVNSGVTAANVTFAGASTSTKLEFNSAIFANYGTFNLTGTGLFQIDANGSFIYNSGTFTAKGNATLYLQGGSNTTHALTNAGTFYAGISGSNCGIEVDDYGSIDNSGQFYLGPTSLIYYYNDLAQYVIMNNQSGGTFTLQSDATGSASIGEVPQGRNNAFTGTFTVQRYFQGGSTYSSGRYVERSYRIISSCLNTGSTVNGNYVFGLNYIVGATAGQTTAANSATNAFITGCTGGSTSAGNPSIYLYNEAYTPSNVTYISGNFLGITNITNSTTGGTISASDGGTYSLPVGTGVLFFFRGAATNWATRTVFPYIAPENVTLTTSGSLNVGAYTFKDWYAPASSNIAYTGSGAGTNSAVRGFNMIGNPYPCALDWGTAYSGSGMVRTNVAPTIWVFNPVTYQYDTYLSTSATTGTATGNASRYVASGQGFIVQATAASPKLTISEYAKAVLNNNGVAGTGAVPAAAQMTGSNLLMGSPVQDFVPQALRLKLAADSISYDDIVISFNANANRIYDPNQDAKYIPGIGASEGLASFSSDDIKLSINSVPLPIMDTREEIKLHVVGSKSGVYTFKRTELDAIPQVYDIWLMDKYKKDSLDIRNNTTYAFNIDLTDTASFGDNRFSIVLRQEPGLAVHLLNFTANKSISGSQISWVTDNEQNYTKFAVERSTDGGTTFNLIGGLSSSAVGNYSMLDKNPVTGSDTYRLKIEDLNGAISYSGPVTLIYGNSGNSAGNIDIYPNPAVGVINLVVNQNTTGFYASGLSALQNANSSPVYVAPQTNNGSKSYNIKITTMSGLVIMSSKSAASTWQNNVSKLAPGTYIVQVLNAADNSLVGKTTFVKL